MAEKCGKCNATSTPVKIGGRSYCGHCGESMAAAKPSMKDLGVRRTASARPAAAVHTRTGLARGGVIDLRTTTPETPKIQPIRRKPALRPKPAATLPETPKQSSTATRSEHIVRFHKPQVAEVVHVAASHSKLSDAPKPVIPPKPEPAYTHLPAHAETHHRAMAKLVTASQKAPQHQRVVPALHRYVAAGLAVVIMGGYVWLQNYPKLELHSASSKAGFTLTLPSYLPSSYSLSGPVQAKNGTAVLSFKSPSIPTPLQITQQVTSWDSSTLRDNFVASKASDYTSVQGQGLTIYIWGQNQAAWVNHGIWYGIEGATNLSREQLLKIAYSL